jgi:hypothetical protein
MGDIIGGIISGIFSAMWTGLGEAIMTMSDGAAKYVALTLFVGITLIFFVIALFNCLNSQGRSLNHHDTISFGVAAITYDTVRSSSSE